MAEKIVLDAEIKTGSAEGSVKSLKTQLKEAQAQVSKMADQFGETSKQAADAAKKAAELKDRIGDAKALTDAFSPDKKFAAVGAAMQGIAGGFAAVQGAMGLMGVESDNVQQQLLKVQSAMALVQGLNALTEAKDAFKNLKTVAVDSFNAIKTAVGGTGIGLIVIALGAIYANFDKLKSLLPGISQEQKALNDTLDDYKKGASEATLKTIQVKTAFDLAKAGTISKKEALKTYNDTLGDTFGKATNLNEAERLYAAKTDTYIKVTGMRAQANALMAKAADEQANALSASMEDQTSFVESWGTSLLRTYGFSSEAAKIDAAAQAEGVKAAQEAALKKKGIYENAAEELLKSATELEQANGIINDNQKQANKENEDLLKQQAEADKQARIQIRNTRQEIALLEIKDEKERAIKKLQFDLENQLYEINQSKASQTEKAQQTFLLSRKLQIELFKLLEQQNKEELKRQEEFQNELQQKKTDTALLGIKDEFEKKRIEQNANFFKELQDLKNNEKLKEEEKLLLITEIQKNNAAKLRAIDEEEAKKRAEIEKETFDMQFEARMNALKNQNQRRLEEEAKRYQDEIDKQLELLNNKEITEDDYNKRREAAKLTHETKLTEIEKTNSDERQKKADEEHQKKVAQIKQVGDTLGTLTEVIGKETAIGKALGIAQATINTYLGATEVLRAKSILPEPAGTVVKLANVAAIIASGIKSVKAIASTKVPGAGGGGGTNPSMPTAAPIGPQMSQTALNQQMINQMGNAASRAFVLESDVSGNQERIRRLNRAARIN